MKYLIIIEQGGNMTSVVIRENDQIMMSLVHYFVTKCNYAPIRVQGVKDEIWLENLEGPYRIIRISSNSIINEEQYNFDIFKMEHIMKQIKKKTLSFNVNALNICLNLDTKINNNNKHINTIVVNSLDEIKDNTDIQKVFPDIKNELITTNDGLELILNVTNDINEKTESENKKYEKVFAPKKLIVTKVIFALCIAMYIISIVVNHKFFEFDPQVLANIGGNAIILVKAGEIWRIITAAFLHTGLIHLIVNMYSLVILGSQVETFIGKTKFIFIYLISAIVGNLLSLIFLPENVVSVGASGALFGLAGALLYFGYHYRLYLNDAIRNQIIPVIAINLLVGLFVGADFYAHIGGLVGGYLSAMAIGIENKSTKKDMINGWIVLILLIVFLSYIIFFVK